MLSFQQSVETEGSTVFQASISTLDRYRKISGNSGREICLEFVNIDIWLIVSNNNRASLRARELVVPLCSRDQSVLGRLGWEKRVTGWESKL